MTKYYLIGVSNIPVTPVDGETLQNPQPGLSHGFQHYVDIYGKLQGHCGTSFWEKHAIPLFDNLGMYCTECPTYEDAGTLELRDDGFIGCSKCIQITPRFVRDD